MKVFEIWVVNRNNENDRTLYGERPFHRLEHSVDMAWERIDAVNYRIEIKEITKCK